MRVGLLQVLAIERAIHCHFAFRATADRADVAAYAGAEAAGAARLTNLARHFPSIAASKTAPVRHLDGRCRLWTKREILEVVQEMVYDAQTEILEAFLPSQEGQHLR
jgi:hypothetical protein